MSKAKKKAQKTLIPSPVKHPNAYVGFSVASATGLLIEEAGRLGVSLSFAEASFIIGAAVYFGLLLGRKVKPGAVRENS